MALACRHCAPMIHDSDSAASASDCAGHDGCKDCPCPTPGRASRHCALVLMHLAPDVGAVLVAEMFKRCRERHAELDITGAILFDGERFGALLCGARDAVEQAVAAVTSDPRQARPRVLAVADPVPPWAPGRWHSGWCEPDALSRFCTEDVPCASAAVDTWRALMAASDLR